MFDKGKWTAVGEREFVERKEIELGNEMFSNKNKGNHHNSTLNWSQCKIGE